MPIFYTGMQNMLQCHLSQTDAWQQRGKFCTVLAELVNFRCHRWCCGMGFKSNQLPRRVSLQGKSQGTARRCLRVDQSPIKSCWSMSWWVALLLGHCRSLQLFLGRALRQERNWKGRERQLCSCQQHLLWLSAGGWGSTESSWQEAEHAWRGCLCQEVILSFQVWLEMQLLEGSSADMANTKLLLKAEQLIQTEAESAVLCKIHVLSSQSWFWEDKRTRGRPKMPLPLSYMSVSFRIETSLDCRSPTRRDKCACGNLKGQHPLHDS